jgi:transcription-repair coupling factor (superfamily II helicase)
MNEAELEETMTDFYEHKFDVLVCTTIIESGVDIPNANTLIVEDADQLGLAQLYQIRGRVGRSDRQAYAVFLYRNAEILTELARQRLAALEEFSQLGAGQKIALRDLELRGAGSLLGLEQSGPVAAVGLDLYLRLLESTVRRLQGKKANHRALALPSVELPVSSGIPESYVASDSDRLKLYGEMASVRDEAEIDRLRTEVEDRYGPVPPLVENAFALLRLRVRCHSAGIREIVFEGGRVTLILRKGHLLPGAIEVALSQIGEVNVSSVTEDRVVLDVSASDALSETGVVIDTLAGALAARRTSRPAAAKKRKNARQPVFAGNDRD